MESPRPGAVQTGSNLWTMKQFATIKLGQTAAKYAEQAPLATACCNACRTCVQTNLIGVALGAVAFAVAPIKRRLRRS